MSNPVGRLSVFSPQLGRHQLTRIALCAILAALFVLGFLRGRREAHLDRYAATGAPAQAAPFRLFWEAWDFLERQFYRPGALNYQAMTHGAIRGMLASLGDSQTVLVEPAEHRLDVDWYKGEFGGIGAVIAVRFGQPVIAAMQEDSPATQAGLQVGDAILTVDGTPVAGLTSEGIEDLLRGEVGSDVELTIEREPDTLSIFVLTRALTELPSVAWQALEGNLGYVQITHFSVKTATELGEALRLLRAQGRRALVLDLRGNAGGLVDSALEVLGRFLDYGVVLREVDASGAEKRYTLPVASRIVDWPMAVLVDSETASAAEIVAAAIRDRGRGKLVGQRTFGKGSVQTVFGLPGGSSVHVSTARWLSADGHPIDGLGVAPDIAVASGQDSQHADAALDSAVAYLRATNPE